MIAALCTPPIYGGGVSPSAIGTNTPLAHVVVSPIVTCAGGVFPSTHWRRYRTCARVTCTVWWWFFGGGGGVFLVVVVVVKCISINTPCIMHMGTTTMHVVSMCKLHVVAAPAPTCADGCWCPVPLTFSNLHWWCFSFQQLAQTLTLHLWWLPSATCAGGLFPSTTCAYSNLHCVVVVVVVVVVVLYMWLW